MPVASVGDINLYYEIQGSGDPLLLIMGYGFSSARGLVTGYVGVQGSA